MQTNSIHWSQLALEFNHLHVKKMKDRKSHSVFVHNRSIMLYNGRWSFGFMLRINQRLDREHTHTHTQPYIELSESKHLLTAKHWLLSRRVFFANTSYDCITSAYKAVTIADKSATIHFGVGGRG